METIVDVSKGYADVMQDAKAFYKSIEANGGSALGTIGALDPADPERDARAIKSYEDRVIAGMVHQPKPGTAAAKAVREHAEARVTLNRWMAKASNGERIATLKDFFTDSNVVSLFPAFIESRIQQARLGTSLVNELIFADEQVNSVTKVSCPYISDTNASRGLKIVAEGAPLPTTTIAVADSDIFLSKYGREINWTYESQATQSIDVIGNMIARIGVQLGIDETDALLDIAIVGDGTTAGAAETNATDTDVAVAGSIAFSDMTSWYYSVMNTTVYNAYQLDKAVLGPTDAGLVAQLGEFSDVEYARGQAALRLPGPVSMQYMVWPGSVTGSHYLDRMVVGIDSRAAFMAYTYGGFISEADKMIDRQINRRTFSYWRGFRKFDAAACAVLDVNTVL